MKRVRHLTIRVAWHDSQWNGTVCNAPAKNSYCVLLDRIRESRNEQAEELIRGKSWADLAPAELPPCKAESGAFMNPQPWVREFEHPYAGNDNCTETHGKLKKRKLTIPPYSAIAVPFWWMLRKNQKEIDQRLVKPLPPDDKAPFPSPWVFGRERQLALSRHFFDQVEAEESLAFFYCKEGHPLGDGISRLVVGVGRILKVGKVEQYDTAAGPSYPLWDRVITHSIRPGEADGFLLPYHEYLKPTGDAQKDEERQRLLQEIAVVAPPAHVGEFSYAAEVAESDVALSTLIRLLQTVRRIREHGIVEGPWQKRENWINQQIAKCWKDRGAFPGTGAALEALGLRLGTALYLELRASGKLDPAHDPWPLLDKILTGKAKPPQDAYAADIEAVTSTWKALKPERRALLELLARFDLTPDQASRIFDAKKRAASFLAECSDKDILENPYVVAELDLGASEEIPVSIGLIDRGLMPDESSAVACPVPKPSGVESPSDRRRIRCGIISVLRDAARGGDTLLSEDETQERLAKLDATSPITVTSDWLNGNVEFLAGTVDRLEIRPSADGPALNALQLSELRAREAKLAKVLRARAAKKIPSLAVDWKTLLRKAITDAGTAINEGDPRHLAALAEQATALERVTTRRMTALVGRAGTGKTSIVGALVACKKLRSQGMLLLAPTGKARVRLASATNAEAMTVAQFLYHLHRYDGHRQRPLFGQGETYKKAKTVVLDEASMLTMDYFAAVLEALDLTTVERIILVGDPNQLPPIGAGRPFADFVAHLEKCGRSDHDEDKFLASALARLTVEVRTKAGAPSDTLRLASWFIQGNPRGEAEPILGEVAQGNAFNDLEVAFWKSDAELRELLLGQFVKQLGLANGSDVKGFNLALGYDEKGWIKFAEPDGVENFQILSPVRMHPYGVKELNRWIQSRFRAAELQRAREHRGTSIGDEGVVVNDKVIQLVNETREGYHWSEPDKDKRNKPVYIANGEIGGVAKGFSGFLNVYFAGRPNIGFGYRGSDFGENFVPLELAYALTIHKAQGSQFRTVFVVIPKASRLLSRELVYTALTRARDKLVLLIEGEDSGLLYELSRPERSDASRRNTNLFASVLRERSDTPPYAEHLIHRTRKGHMVRSKSELVIANLLFTEGLADKYEYEKPLKGIATPGCIYPDFSFADAAGDRVVWEHLGMMDDPDYQKSWLWKKNWYLENGYELGRNLFVTEETGAGLDTAKLLEVVRRISTEVA